MGEIKVYTPEKLVMGILISNPDQLETVKKKLTDRWGDIDSGTEAVEFSYTEYYKAEMGWPIYRVFCSFQPLIDPESLAEIKVMTNDVESGFLRTEGRTVNLDPGILCQSKFILATTKNNAHRIPMSRGIYGELTLQYKRGEFRELEWTYPDYRGDDARSYLLKVRKIYVAQLEALKNR